MITVLDFMNENNTYGKTAVASVFKLISNDDESESGSEGGSSGGLSEDSSSGESSDSQSSGSGESQGGSSSGGGSSGGGSSDSGGSSGSGSDKNSKMYFSPNTPTFVFVDGKFVLEISDKEENSGFLIAQKKTKTSYVEVKDFQDVKLKDAKVSVIVKSKKVRKKVHFNGNVPCLDLKIVIDNAEVNEVNSNEKDKTLSNAQIDEIKDAMKKKISDDIGSVFEKAKENGADLFKAYEIAYKFNYNDLTKFYNTEEDFIKNLLISVDVQVLGLEN